MYDKVLDLRFCDFTNDKTNLKGKTLSAALMSEAKFDGADMTEVVMSKAYAVGASFKGNRNRTTCLNRFFTTLHYSLLHLPNNDPSRCAFALIMATLCSIDRK